MPAWRKSARCSCVEYRDDENGEERRDDGDAARFAQYYHENHCLLGMLAHDKLPPEYKKEMHPFYWAPTLLAQQREQRNERRMEEEELKRQEAIKLGVL
jgi:hypothetical protein